MTATDQRTCSSYEWEHLKSAWRNHRYLRVVQHGSALLLYEIDAALYRVGRRLGANR